MSKRAGWVTRRVAFKGAASLVASAALAPLAAKAQTGSKRIVLSTWGGDYAKLLTKHVSTPALAPKGWTVVNDEAQVVQRKAKTMAEKRLPTGSSDVQALTATDVAEMAASDTLEKLDLSKLKNAKNIIKTFSIADSPLFSPHIYSGKVVLYNPKLIKDVPTGMDSLWDPKNQGKVGIVDIQHVYTTMAAALVGGGKTGDFDIAKKSLLELK
jgi:putative spermidine/putrescine transport system substrate-binding protein